MCRQEVKPMKARDIMTPRPFVVTPSDSVARAAELMRYENIGGVPVVNDPARPQLVGLITDRDIAIRCVARGLQAQSLVGDVMTPAPLKTVGPDADVEEIVKCMEAAEVRRIPVVSDDGILIGIVAEADLATKVAAAAALPMRKRVKAMSADPYAHSVIR
jgi:CBS domain-containing protein